MMMFDTFKLARGLTAAGMPQAQAETIAVAFNDAAMTDLATKADLAVMGAELKADILKWVLGALGLQTVVVVSAMVTLVVTVVRR